VERSSRGGEKEMEKDPVILYEKKSRAIRIDPQAGLGRKFLKNFSWIAGGELMRRRLKSKFANAVDQTEMDKNDIKDLTDRWRKHVSITLTKDNLIFNWKQGYGFKKKKTAVLPLIYMTKVENKGTVGKTFCVDFEVPSDKDDESFAFTLKIVFCHPVFNSVSNQKKQELWMTELRRIKAQS